MHNAVHKDARGDDRFWIEGASFNNFRGLHNGHRCGGGHHGRKVSRGAVVQNVPVRVGFTALDKREVCANAVLKDMLAVVEDAGLFAFRERCSHCGWRVERHNSSAASADSLCECSLRDQFKFNLPRSIQIGEHGRASGLGERANDLTDALGTQKRGESNQASAGVVAHHGQALRALIDQGMNELDWTSCFAEATNHDGRAIEDVGDRLAGATNALIDHRQDGVGDVACVTRALLTRE